MQVHRGSIREGIITLFLIIPTVLVVAMIRLQIVVTRVIFGIFFVACFLVMTRVLVVTRVLMVIRVLMGAVVVVIVELHFH